MVYSTCYVDEGTVVVSTGNTCSVVKYATASSCHSSSSMSSCSYSYSYTDESSFSRKYDPSLWRWPPAMPRTSRKLIKPKAPPTNNFIRCMAPERMRQYRCQMRNK